MRLSGYVWAGGPHRWVFYSAKLRGVSVVGKGGFGVSRQGGDTLYSNDMVLGFARMMEERSHGRVSESPWLWVWLVCV